MAPGLLCGRPGGRPLGTNGWAGPPPCPCPMRLPPCARDSPRPRPHRTRSGKPRPGASAAALAKLLRRSPLHCGPFGPVRCAPPLFAHMQLTNEPTIGGFLPARALPRNSCAALRATPSSSAHNTHVRTPTHTHTHAHAHMRAGTTLRGTPSSSTASTWTTPTWSSTTAAWTRSRAPLRCASAGTRVLREWDQAAQRAVLRPMSSPAWEGLLRVTDVRRATRCAPPLPAP